MLDHLLTKRIWLHILFWLVFTLFSYATFSFFLYESFPVYLANLVAILPSQILFTYILLYYLIPQFLLNRRYLLFGLFLLSALYIAMVVSRVITIHVVEEITNRGFPKEPLSEILTEVSHLLSRYFLPVISAPLMIVPIKLLKDKLEERTKIEELKKEKAEAQLNFLKAQINPHFLFNTLNNLYLLTLDKRDEAPEIVLKLSEILDYLLYQCNGPSVPVAKEIELIQNYIGLEKIRYGNRLDLLFTHDIKNKEARFAPLILLTLVENAFKHAGENSEGKVKIRISLEECEEKICFSVENSTKEKIVEGNQGIGMANLQSQLDLLYTEKYKLKVNNLDDSYGVYLEVEI